MTQQLTVTQKITNYRQMMSLNSSSTAPLHLRPPSLPFIDFMLQRCLKSTVGIFSITAFAIASVVVLLPLCVFVLHLGCRRWRRQHSGTKTSHSDLFTYNMVLIELVTIGGSTSICCGVHADLPVMVVLGICLLAMHYSGQMLLHVLTCVERYLAVLHPVAYLSMRKSKAVRIRNFTIVVVWLQCLSSSGYMFLTEFVFMAFVASTVPVSLAVICFCSVSVLCALIRPGPGEGGGDKQKVDQSKLRAFHTILSILGVLLLRFGGIMVITGLYGSLGDDERCGLWLSDLWFCLPSGLVLPLLFLHRAGKLPCWKNSGNPGAGSHQSSPCR